MGSAEGRYDPRQYVYISRGGEGHPVQMPFRMFLSHRDIYICFKACIVLDVQGLKHFILAIIKLINNKSMESI